MPLTEPWFDTGNIIKLPMISSIKTTVTRWLRILPRGDSQACLHFSFQLSPPFNKPLFCSHQPLSSNHGGIKSVERQEKRRFVMSLVGRVCCPLVVQQDPGQSALPRPLSLRAETVATPSSKGGVSNKAELPEPTSKPVNCNLRERARVKTCLQPWSQETSQILFASPHRALIWGHGSAAPHKPTPLHSWTWLQATPQSPHPK